MVVTLHTCTVPVSWLYVVDVIISVDSGRQDTRDHVGMDVRPGSVWRGEWSVERVNIEIEWRVEGEGGRQKGREGLTSVVSSVHRSLEVSSIHVTSSGLCSHVFMEYCCVWNED